jgi:capsular polysaccharide transport system permease protein
MKQLKKRLMSITNFNKSAGWRLYMLFVVLPTMGIFLYLSFLASPRYESQAKFFIRSYESSGLSGGGLLSNLLQVQGSVSSMDAEIIRDYLMSTDVLRSVDAELGISRRWQGEQLDFFSSLPKDGSFEVFHQKYLERIHVEIAPSGIVSVRYQDYSPGDTATVLNHLIKASEFFVNAVSHQLANEQVDFIRQEVKAAEMSLKEVRLRLQQYQNQTQSLSPEKDIEIILGNISALEMDLARVRSQLSESRSYLSEDSIQVRSLLNQAAALEDEIINQHNRLVGSDQSVNDTLTTYHALKLEEEFATKAFSAAYASLEQAQLEATRKLKSLVLIESPVESTEADYPRVLYWTVTTFILSGLAVFFIRLFIAVVREHNR